MGWHEDAIRLNDSGLGLPEIVGELRHYWPNDSNKQIRKRIWLYLDRQGKEINKKSYVPNDLPPNKEGRSYQTDGSVISQKFIELRNGVALSEKEMLELHGFNSEMWEVVTCTNNFWNSQLKGGALQISYQSKVVARPVKGAISYAEIDKHFNELQTAWKPPERKPYSIGTRLAEVNVADLHYGKLAWHGDTGNDYDHKIAKSIYFQIINEVCHELTHRGIELIRFVWANDFFNSDNEEQTTTKGTRQDTDGRWIKIFNSGCDMLIDGIAMLAEIAPVETFYLPSNHDERTAYSALSVVRAHYRNDKAVTVDFDACPRKYRLYGNTLIGYTHGADESNKRLSMLMPNEARDLWARAKYCEMHAAHLHQEKLAVEELNGVIVRRVSAPTANDAWHVKSGFIGNVRKAQTFVYDKDRGLIMTLNTPV